MADFVERQMLVAHAIEVVWEAITTAEGLAGWFGDVAEIDLRPGGAARFGWEGSAEMYEARVEVVTPPHTFAFTWAALKNRPLDESPSTLVTFTLTSDGGKTLVEVSETGFASLPEELRDKALAENTSGWAYEFDDLQAYLAGLDG